MKNKFLFQVNKKKIHVEHLSFLIRLSALIMLVGSLTLVADAKTTTDLTEENFPNAIRITAEDMETMMVGNDPYGLLNYLSLHTGLTFRSTGDFGAEDWFTVRGFGRDNSRLTLVLLDGRPINLAGNHFSMY